jgi:glucan biosynthesis protein C
VDTAPRYHALDALRAAMMLLGIVLHAMASYSSLPLGDAWPFRDPQTSRHFNLPLLVIHIFRMPVFFAMAGFFAALLYQRGGSRKLLVNRTKRVLLPFLIFWFALVPPMAGGFLFAIHESTGTPVRDIVSAGAETTPLTTMHLWFLHYLVIFYAAALVVLSIGSRWVPGERISVWLTTSPLTVIVWSAVTLLTLLPMPFAGIQGSTLLLPPVRTLVAYGVFFVFGWLLWSGRGELGALARRWKSHLALAGAGIVGYIVLELRPLEDPRAGHAAACTATALSTWGFILGLTGAFLQFASAEHTVVRYLSRAAYWTYLVHLPVVIWTAAALVHAPLSAFAKFAIVLTVTTAVCLVSYHYLVRTTVIGALLNGTRQPDARREQSALVPSG